MISKRFVMLLTAGAFLAGVAASISAFQTRAISSGAGGSSAGIASCDPGFRLPVSRAAMYAVDAVLVGLIGAACVTAYNLLAAAVDSKLLRLQVVAFTAAAFFEGVGVSYSAFPACANPSGAGASSAGPASCDPVFCRPFSRAVMCAIDVCLVGLLGVVCYFGVYRPLADEDEDKSSGSKN